MKLILRKHLRALFDQKKQRPIVSVFLWLLSNYLSYWLLVDLIQVQSYFDKSRPRLASIAKRKPFKRMKPSASF